MRKVASLFSFSFFLQRSKFLTTFCLVLDSEVIIVLYMIATKTQQVQKCISQYHKFSAKCSSIIDIIIQFHKVSSIIEIVMPILGSPGRYVASNYVPK